MSVNKTFNSKTMSMIFLGLLAMFAIFIGPVSAADNELIIKSTVPTSLSFSLQPKIVNFPLSAVGDNIQNGVSDVTVNSNTPFTMKVVDTAGNGGKMRLFDGNSQLLDTYLINNLQVSAGTGSTNWVPLSGTPSVITSAGAGSTIIPINLKQVLSFNDAPTSGLYVYQTNMAIQCSATP